MTTNEEIQVGRAKNAVLAFLENRLIVPKIYLDADWDGRKVDALAIERDGVGDVHVVLLFARQYFDNKDAVLLDEYSAEKRLIENLIAIPANYKYLGVIEPETEPKTIPLVFFPPLNEVSFSPDGLGRVGFLRIEVPAGEGKPEAQLEIKPERFRAKIAKLADEYVQQHEADWEIRA